LSESQGQGLWQQGSLLEIEIEDLNHQGDGVGRWQGRVVFVPDTVVGDRLEARLLRVKPSFAHAQLQTLLAPSPWRIRPRCIVADKCGGCQWQHISDEFQLQTKRQQAIDALKRIGGFVDPPVSPEIIQGSGSLGYRNKSTYPLARSQNGTVQAGYYRRHSHQLVNLNQCPIQDYRLNPLLSEIKQDIQKQGWSIYNESLHQGKLRHLSLRIGRRTGEMHLTLIGTDRSLAGLEEQAQSWCDRYSSLTGVSFNLNPHRGNRLWGEETLSLAGQETITEEFAGLKLSLRPETFFQVNTEAAENLLTRILAQLELNGQEQVIDAYCGIGTFTLPLARRLRRAIGIESNPASVEQARINAALNGLDNVEFWTGDVAELLPKLEMQPDLIWLDPPRKGCDRQVLLTIHHLTPAKIVYISCQPATLARDLRYLCEGDRYSLKWIQIADFFPQTAHVEMATLLTREPYPRATI
jgi:23S rRNA (uracil1939-C5)-methyltransferase